MRVYRYVYIPIYFLLVKLFLVYMIKYRNTLFSKEIVPSYLNTFDQVLTQFHSVLVMVFSLTPELLGVLLHHLSS